MQYRFVVLSVLLVGCTQSSSSVVDPCDLPGAFSECSSPTRSEEYYVAQSSAYFDTMDYTVDLEDWPPYSELVARWEWPPWLILTAFGRDHIEATDSLLRFFPSIVTDRECRAFDEQPFGRCYVVFYYDEHEGKGCPIYEEFTFNDEGEITFIEAWSDVDGLRPTSEGDRWGERSDIGRLSTRVPGLGTSTGLIDLEGEAMTQAATHDEDIEEFVYRAQNWLETWSDAYAAAGNEMWDVGCGW